MNQTQLVDGTIQVGSNACGPIRAASKADNSCSTPSSSSCCSSSSSSSPSMAVNYYGSVCSELPSLHFAIHEPKHELILVLVGPHNAYYLGGLLELVTDGFLITPLHPAFFINRILNTHMLNPLQKANQSFNSCKFMSMYRLPGCWNGFGYKAIHFRTNFIFRFFLKVK